MKLQRAVWNIDKVPLSCTRSPDNPKVQRLVSGAMVKAQKLTENKGHPHVRDYDDDITQEFMVTVIREYHVCLCAQAPMPDHTQEMLLLNTSWARVFQVTSVNLACTLQLVKLISQSKSAIKKNQALAEELKEGMNFTFKHMAAQEDGWCEFLKAPLIQKIMNMMWFANKHDDSITFPNHFKPFPYLALALVLTAIHGLPSLSGEGIDVDIMAG
ncbi:hypothetical protein EDC04DRAFT_2610307 [Pisolithus marmoratus]|nr:hypothetical protein EDC04DRAFT_2610307 [Pisolithus marmoratus]